MEKPNKSILRFDAFVNETRKVNEDGYGESQFFFAKNGDTANYFFKIGEDHKRGFVLGIGKFSKFSQPTEAKAEYGVLSITELEVDKLDQAVIDKGKFEPNENKIEVDEREINKIMENMMACVNDYLQKNPKVIKFYDEMQNTLHSDDYTRKLSTYMEKWPGPWNLQEVERGRLNFITK